MVNFHAKEGLTHVGEVLEGCDSKLASDEESTQHGTGEWKPLEVKVKEMKGVGKIKRCEASSADYCLRITNGGRGEVKEGLWKKCGNKFISAMWHHVVAYHINYFFIAQRGWLAAISSTVRIISIYNFGKT